MKNTIKITEEEKKSLDLMLIESKVFGSFIIKKYKKRNETENTFLMEVTIQATMEVISQNWITPKKLNITYK